FHYLAQCLACSTTGHLRQDRPDHLPQSGWWTHLESSTAHQRQPGSSGCRSDQRLRGLSFAFLSNSAVPPESGWPGVGITHSSGVVYCPMMKGFLVMIHHFLYLSERAK